MKKVDVPMHKNLKNLIALLYGLAIATGLEHAVPEVFEYCDKQKLEYIPLVLLAFIVGLSDWAVYHLYAAPFFYSKITRWSAASRVILDILFPIIVYILFVSAASTQCFYVVLSIYTLLSLVYLALLRKEKIEVRTHLFWQYSLSFLISLTISTVNLSNLFIPQLIAIGLVVLWVLLTGSLFFNMLFREKRVPYRALRRSH